MVHTILQKFGGYLPPPSTSLARLTTAAITLGCAAAMNGVLPGRGALIVFEGCDRVGKSTQCDKLVKALREVGKKCHQMHFPGTMSVYLYMLLLKYSLCSGIMHSRG